MISSQTLCQEDMQTWFSRLNSPNFYSKKIRIMPLMAPQFKNCSFEKKELTLAFEVKDWELNPEGGLHGGMIVTGFDMTFGILCHYFAKPNMVCTMNLSTTFIQPVLPNDTVEYHVRIISQGKNVVSLTGEARLQRENILAATASTSFMILNKQMDVLK